MGFSEKYTFNNLYKIFIMMMHPVFSLAYKLDPQIPRFYKFLVLFTRIIILMGIYFFTLRNHADFEVISGTEGFAQKVCLLVAWSVAGSAIFIPLPMFVYCCFKSSYKLLIEKDNKSLHEDDFTDIRKGKKSSPTKGKKKTKDEIIKSTKGQPEQVKLPIDPGIPIKLLFLINATPVNSIARKYTTRLAYMSGDS